MSEITKQATTLTDVSRPVFGEWFTGIYASDDNPKKHGRYVRTIRRSGRMNPGTFYELTDGHGRFWQYPVDSIVRRATDLMGALEDSLARIRLEADLAALREAAQAVVTSPTALLAEFHDALGDDVGRGNAPLRITLHREEHEELVEALELCAEREKTLDGAPPPDALKALARELADVIYIAYGTAHAYDINLDAAVREIHRAAMSKIVRPNGEPPVRRADGKVLKPPEFVPPDMAEAIWSGYPGYPLSVLASADSEDPAAGIPPDLARVLRDPNIVIAKDREIMLDGKPLLDHIREWRNAPSNTASADSEEER